MVAGKGGECLGNLRFVLFNKIQNYICACVQLNDSRLGLSTNCDPLPPLITYAKNVLESEKEPAVVLVSTYLEVEARMS